MTYPSKQNPKLYEYHRLREREAGNPRLVPVEPTRRKVQALAWLGWSLADMAKDFGTSQQALQKSLRKDMIRRTTAAKVDGWYLDHEMTHAPDTPYSRRTRAAARRAGWLPPLAWEDIEAGVLADQVVEVKTAPRDRFDLLEVDYVLQYADWAYAKARLSPLEKAEVVRLWLASGRSEAELCRLTGWKEGRYRSAA